MAVLTNSRSPWKPTPARTASRPVLPKEARERLLSPFSPAAQVAGWKSPARRPEVSLYRSLLSALPLPEWRPKKIDLLTRPPARPCGPFCCIRIRLCQSEILVQVSGNQLEQVKLGVSPLADTMSAVGIVHHGEGLVGCDESVDQHLGVLKVYVVVAAAMNQQQVSL